MSFGEIKEALSDGQTAGLSQEARENLRTEFVSLGGLVTSLPNPAEVRDFTISVIMSKDADGKEVVNLYMMINGKWFNLNEYQEVATGAYGAIDQFNTTSTMNIAQANKIYEITSANITPVSDDWTLNAVRLMEYSDGVFSIQRAGNYKISWSISFSSASANQDYEAGILKNAATDNYGWAHRKISTASDVGSFSATTILSLKSGDKVSIGVQDITSAANFIINHASFTILRLR